MSIGTRVNSSRPVTQRPETPAEGNEGELEGMHSHSIVRFRPARSPLDGRRSFVGSLGKTKLDIWASGG